MRACAPREISAAPWETHSLRDTGALSLSRLREAVAGVGTRVRLEDALTLGTAAPMTVAFFRVRCASEVAQRSTGDVRVGADAGAWIWGRMVSRTAG